MCLELVEKTPHNPLFSSSWLLEAGRLTHVMSLNHTWQEPSHLPGDPPSVPTFGWHHVRLPQDLPSQIPAQVREGCLSVSEKQGREEWALPPRSWLLPSQGSSRGLLKF